MEENRERMHIRAHHSVLSAGQVPSLWHSTEYIVDNVSIRSTYFPLVAQPARDLPFRGSRRDRAPCTRGTGGTI